MRKVKSKSYEYMESLMGAESEAKMTARRHAESLGLEGISLSPVEAQILRFCALSVSAKKIIEIGTLTGLSALYLLENGGPDVKLWTLEKSDEHAALARDSLRAYIENGQCEIVIGDAREKLAALQSRGPFDCIFIDGNKAAYLDYFDWAVANVRAGGLVVADNVFLAGAVWGDQSLQRFNQKQVEVVSEMNRRAFSDPKLSSMFIPTEEGLLICKKLS